MCVTVWDVALLRIEMIFGELLRCGTEGMSFLCSNFRVDAFLYSNQEGFDAVIKNMGLMGILRDVNSREKYKSNFGDQSTFVCSLSLL